MDLHTILEFLEERDLLSVELKEDLNDLFNKKKRKATTIKMPFGKFKGKTIEEINKFNPEYLQWLVKQTYLIEKFQDIYGAIVELNK